MVDLCERYNLTSNHEHGFRRYVVMLEPQKPDPATNLEFKIYNPQR